MVWIELEAILLSPITWFVFLFGSLFGSFFNVCIYRIPRGIFWESSRSKCPSCGTLIPFWYNIPIFSWLFLRGKSACCGTKISPQYPLVEFGTAVLFVIIYWQFPFFILADGTIQGFDPQQALRCLHATIFCSVLLICSVIDLEHQIIPDVLSLPLIAVAPLVALVHPELDLKSSLFGILLGGGSFYAVAWLYYLIRKDYGLGLGDVKLLAGIGGWLGYQSILTTIFWASLLGSVVGVTLIVINRKKDLKLKLPFGPFLSVAAALYLLFGHQLAGLMFTF